MKPITWKNCYSQQWAGILISAAFAHPAKISLALVKKIFAHALENGWIQKGDTCLDPFAGIGGVAFGAMLAGLKFVGQELEPHFVDLANSIACTGISKTDWVQFYERWERVNRRNGRHWCPNCLAQAKQVIKPAVKTKDLFDLLGTASYERNSGKIPFTLPHRFEGNLEFWKRKFGLSGAVILQGDSRRLLENLRDQVECVVSSPPYANSICGNGNGIDFEKIKDGGTNRTAAREAIGTGYGDSPAQLAAMPEGRFDITVSSPPFEDMEMGCNSQAVRKDLVALGRNPVVLFGRSNGQLGGSGATFWSAAREIVEQCFLALKPGGHAIWVCKNFVRKGQVVEFSQQWARLCEAVGFELVCWHQASLVEVGASQLNVHGEDTVKIKSRKSFFRRLAEKNGSPEINHEDVICFVKPTKTFERLYLDGRNGKSELKTERVTL